MHKLNPAQLTNALKSEARICGFDLVGVCPAVTAVGFHRLIEWIESGFAGEMDYLATRLPAYEHPDHVLQPTASLMMLGMNYRSRDPRPATAGTGRIARYAWGEVDYHDLIQTRLKQLKQFANNLFADAGIKEAQVRGVVDTAPLLEREFAQLAGLGWFAKNTMLINRPLGSWFFIAAMLTNVELEYDSPLETSHCGTCTACLDACPTDAFPQPGVLDATRCISYLTIEHRSSIPVDLREGIGDWVLGCDICQEVCPWNRKAPQTEETAFYPQPKLDRLDLRGLFDLSEDQFRAEFRKTPLWRPRRRGILRNAAIALGNQPDSLNLPALNRGLHDPEELIRSACAWALGRHPMPTVMEKLHFRKEIESSPEVLSEIQAAIEVLQAAS